VVQGGTAGQREDCLRRPAVVLERTQQRVDRCRRRADLVAVDAIRQPARAGGSADQVIGPGRVERPGHVVGGIVGNDLMLSVERSFVIPGKNGVEQADRAGARVDIQAAAERPGAVVGVYVLSDGRGPQPKG